MSIFIPPIQLDYFTGRDQLPEVTSAWQIVRLCRCQRPFHPHDKSWHCVINICRTKGKLGGLLYVHPLQKKIGKNRHFILYTLVYLSVNLRFFRCLVETGENVYCNICRTTGMKVYIQNRTTINNDGIITDITITATAVLAITSRTFSHHHTPIIIRLSSLLQTYQWCHPITTCGFFVAIASGFRFTCVVVDAVVAVLLVISRSLST